MKPSLRLHHAKVLAALTLLSPFEQIVALRSLLEETEDMNLLIRRELSQTLNTLRDNGAGWKEIVERTGIAESTLTRFTKGRS